MIHITKKGVNWLDTGGFFWIEADREANPLFFVNIIYAW